MHNTSYIYRARINRVVDGDTFDATVDLGFHTYGRHRFRLYDVDTPERGQPGYKEATEKLRELLTEAADEHGNILIFSRKSGKYGRWIATVYVGAFTSDRTASWLLQDWMNETGFNKP